MNKSIFIPINKVIENPDGTCDVFGRAAVEEVDRSREIFDYATSKPLIQKWSQGFNKVTNGQSLGNLRAMHNKIAAGKITGLDLLDDQKAVDIATKVVDINEANKCREGVYTGFSIGGGYAKRWPDPNLPGVMRYTADLSEISLVDNPCMPSANFSLVKVDGTTEMRKFADPQGDVLRKVADLAHQMRERFSEAVEAGFLGKDHVTQNRSADGTWVGPPELNAAGPVQKAIGDAEVQAAAGQSDEDKQKQDKKEDLLAAHREPAGAAAVPDLEQEAKPVGKTVDGTVLLAKDFAYVGDAQDTETWQLPLDEPGRAQTSLAKFQETVVPPDMKKKVARRLITAARHHGIDASQFATEHASTILGGEFKKGMLDVATHAQLVEAYAALEERLEHEAEVEQDDSKLADRMAGVLREMQQLFVDHATEESAELVAEEDAEKLAAASNQLEKEMVLMAFEMNKFMSVVNGATSLESLKKEMPTHLKEIGKHVDGIAGAHKQMANHIGALMGDAGEKPDASAAERAPEEAAEKLNKAAGAAVDELAKRYDDKITGLEKTITTQKETIDKMAADMAKGNELLVSFIQKFYDQPAPTKSVVATFPVEKVKDGVDPAIAASLEKLKTDGNGGPSKVEKVTDMEKAFAVLKDRIVAGPSRVIVGRR